MDTLSTPSPRRYGATASRHSQKAAAAASGGRVDAVLKHASKAAESLDLWHPDGWWGWIMADEDLAMKALAFMNPKEAPLASAALDGHDHDICYAFADKPRLLRAMREAGIDIDSAKSFLGNPETGSYIAPAFLLAWENDAASVDRLIEAGCPSPGKLSAEEARIFNSSSAPRTVLHLLAGSGASDETSVETMARICAWCGPDQIDARNHLGKTPLAIAAAGFQFTLAHALLDAGANSFLTDRKDHSVRALFERRLSQDSRLGIAYAHPIAQLRARLDAIELKGELASTVGAAPPRPRTAL